jgi:hypothetical protein
MTQEQKNITQETLSKTYNVTKLDEMRYIATNRYYANDNTDVDISNADRAKK